MPAPPETLELNKKPTLGPFFLDSGAHSLYELTQTEGRSWDWFDSDEFWQYVDKYAEFIKTHKGIDYYANVDVVFDAKRTWKVQKYLEYEHGLCPIPVIHCNTHIKWLHKYLDAGYDPIALGGFGQDQTKASYFKWADEFFDVICPRPSRLPIVRVHGFAMTSFQLLRRYPWWGVDSASWTKASGFGRVFVPRLTNDEFTFDRDPYCIVVSADARAVSKTGHIQEFAGKEATIVKRWLKIVGVPLGSVDAEGEVVEYGVCNSHGMRRIANLRFFQAMADSLPEWPWPFRLRIRRALVKPKRTHVKVTNNGKRELRRL